MKLQEHGDFLGIVYQCIGYSSRMDDITVGRSRTTMHNSFSSNNFIGIIIIVEQRVSLCHYLYSLCLQIHSYTWNFITSKVFLTKDIIYILKSYLNR